MTELTVQELEASGYNEAAQHALAGDQVTAAWSVVNAEARYDDAQDRAVREKAIQIVAASEASAPKARLEELRAALRAENISYGELAELQSLSDHIDPGDVELLEAAGVPESAPDDPDGVAAERGQRPHYNNEGYEVP